MDRKSLLRACAAEALGTFVLVLFGIGSVATAVFTGAQVGLWQVAVVWGIGVTLAIYVSSAASGAHLNPAISLAFAIFRRAEFPIVKMLSYWAAQMAGAIVAGICVFLIFNTVITDFEVANGIVRGEPGSERSAMAFGEYFPNPAMYEANDLHITAWHAFAVEAFGTAVLALVIFAVVDRRNTALPNQGIAPLLIGFTVAALISLFAPLTQAGWNPARDFGPRIVSLIAGWGEVAIPGPEMGFWVYIAGPLLGAPLGAMIFEIVIAPALKRDSR